MKISPTFLFGFAAIWAVAGLSSAAPQWIWAGESSPAQGKVLLKKEFDLPAGVKRATLMAAADNAAKISINGQRALANDNWQEPSQGNVAKLLKAGKNEIAVLAENDEGTPAGFVLSLALEDAEGKKSVIETGADWQAGAENGGNLAAVRVIAPMGAKPWGNVFASVKKGGSVLPGSEVQTLPGFRADLVYTVPRGEQGSWVSMTVDPQGRLICGDQYGGLYRLTPPPPGPIEDPQQTKVEKLASNVGGAHGLLWAFDSLYVMVNEDNDKRGLWRLSGLREDGSFEKEQHLRKFKGGGEHGPHAIVLSPDGKSLYIACGNHTHEPDVIDKSRPARLWKEDHLLPRMWDANGHAVNVMAPGGYIMRTDPEGKELEMFCYGFRNEYDIAFNTEGELFTFDSDMEWDMGAPWYRPTRIIHCVSGADYGWRSGSGKWPSYYPDALPGTSDIGPGSPTGVVFGTGAKFPAKYQAAFYAADWTYGTMYAVHVQPDGATYKAEVEEFVSGKPLPLTDVLIHPQDGSMYFATGGRRTQSALYRVSYVGEEKAAPVADPIASGSHAGPAFSQRHELEKLHETPIDGSAAKEVVEKAWPHLAHPDRFVRYAARVAIERQPVESWVGRLRAENNRQAIIEGGIALARAGKGSDAQQVILQKLAALHGSGEISREESLGILRLVGLTFIRQGKPAPDIARAISDALDGLYPSTDDDINRELCQILVYLDSPRVVAKTLQLMATAREIEGGEKASAALLERNQQYAKDVQKTVAGRPNRQQMALAWSLRSAKAGWTPELRKQYFSWYSTAKKWQGGNSFAGFIENARKDALANVPEAERAEMDALSTKVETPAELTFTPAKGPGRPYTVDDVLKFAEGALHGRDYASGKNLYAAAACLTCHRFNGEGGGLGPDVTGSGNRYTLRDLLENIIDPSKVISDQYESTQIDLKDGSLLVGRVMREEGGKLFVAVNPLAPTEVMEIAADTVASRKPYPISMMPPGLLNQLNEGEVLDLLAYLLSGGNPGDKVFQK